METSEKLKKRLEIKEQKYEAILVKIEECEKVRKKIEFEMKELRQQSNFLNAKKLEELLEQEGLENVSLKNLINVIAENKERLSGNSHE